ncbi:hypothetical protein A3C09_04785 [Candidatus Uhrbacteria bacterium RIFCSPHIGHO2_02_FULL_47_44]|uniref:Uncharacterized protein n=1 Tax=Candidatus Uhrbacteria bacterium RIFCSPLOWO2_02_FULL_48_18 TaxID=1802408 RepID=A0A1F7VE36_9BACT|nr:MAG: hypothetical protein A2839_00940 [Candidatus Uhrbacteria bacterium RIFCSPHIGHO2_01_FULL_47_10]OGL71945.1 MAG: hypothetical protein A3C09_04785 [Candidatus Uhrbacteria bacterium RIFCSPHIGHO2_02_FULL_47_44]OGL76815.1 MAG: hypothetical protein A3E97_04545 [Candidatus Uhrbacteria bacterium RIFCSPHIGHO2_12_FULL_47_12]OGL80570.1 MAG: hypothetical protein A3B20_04180 [Candidatus Uhrbacteria bacterium RIFCSPLOWO2_01_FULL_47_17]OGL88247.1 MAG: hypothetical protein A3I41_00800 [Candidatus Uhrbact
MQSFPGRTKGVPVAKKGVSTRTRAHHPKRAERWHDTHRNHDETRREEQFEANQLELVALLAMTWPF